jgi:AbrB family transcriptional regulator (stage V sporulation protein T)
MKETGIVRRIDTLGRVVIPKEIRRTMRIRERTFLEIYTNSDGEIILKKYSPIEELARTAVLYAEAVNKTCEFPMVVVDRDNVVACAGIPKKDIMEHKISSELDMIISTCQFYVWSSDDTKVMLIDDDSQDKFFAKIVAPIFTDNIIIGAVVIAEAKTVTEATETEIKFAKSAAAFLGKRMDT